MDLAAQPHLRQNPWFLDVHAGRRAACATGTSGPTPIRATAARRPKRLAPGADAYYYGVFGRGLPDLNLTNPAVTGALEDAARFWLTDVGVDGFRLDAIKHLLEDGARIEDTLEHTTGCGTSGRAITSIKPGALLVGEVYDVTRGELAYVPEDVDQVVDFELAGATVDAIARAVRPAST